MTSNITYRVADFKDSIQIDKINRECLPENYELETIIAFILGGRNCSYVALDDDVIVGYCLVLIDQSKQAHIVSLAVSSNYRRLNIAKRLILSSLTSIKKIGFDNTFLFVRPSNKNALALYEKLGFTLLHKKPEYYEDKEDAYVMIRRIENTPNYLGIMNPESND